MNDSNNLQNIPKELTPEEQEFQNFLEYFDNKIPNPEQYPKQFEYCVKMYKFHKGYK